MLDLLCREGVFMAGIDSLPANEDFFGVVFQYVVGIVCAVSHRHAASRCVGTVYVGPVIAAVVE